MLQMHAAMTKQQSQQQAMLQQQHDREVLYVNRLEEVEHQAQAVRRSDLDEYQQAARLSRVRPACHKNRMASCPHPKKTCASRLG